MFGFLVLNIGLPVLDSLPGWQRVSDGLLQSLSVRASGFGIVAIPNLAPSVLFLYIVSTAEHTFCKGIDVGQILMYVAIYRESACT
jgi:hypothetical protein